MLRMSDSKDGTPVRIYRSPAQIRSDIENIKSSIAETNSRLDLRALLVDMLDDGRTSDPRELVILLEEAAGEARESLTMLTRLSEELSSLEEELRVTRWAMGL